MSSMSDNEVIFGEAFEEEEADDGLGTLSSLTEEEEDDVAAANRIKDTFDALLEWIVNASTVNVDFNEQRRVHCSMKNSDVEIR